jgi:hypothetical protein
MAILHGGPNGGFSGKAGSIVGVMRLGTAIIRSMPKLSRKNKKGTPAQNANRSLFTKMQYFLSPVLDFIRVGFNIEGRSKNMTAHNAAKSYNMLNAFNAEGDIDFSKVLLSFGRLPGALNATVAKGDDGICFTWENNSTDKWASSNDQVMVLVFDTEKNNAYYLTSGARRNTKMDTLIIPPSAKTQTLHTWIAFIADNRERVSMSSYLGMV